MRSLRSGDGANAVYYRRVFFCSESGGGGDQPMEAKAVEEVEAESKASSAIVPTNPRPEDYLTVRAPLRFRKSSFFIFKLVLWLANFFAILLHGVCDLD